MKNEPIRTNAEVEAADPAVMGIKPTVSVLMVTYNHGEYLAEAIKGVISQKTDFSIELIIGEDCSADNTRAIALEFQRLYPQIIRVIYSDRNVGGCANLTRCFTRSRAEFVAYCEGDDFWHDPLKLQKQVDFLRANPGFSAVHSDYDRVAFSLGHWRRIKAVNKSENKIIPQGDIYHQLITSKVRMISCTFLSRVNLLNKHVNSVLNSPEFPVGDLPVKLHMSKLGMIGYIDESLGSYRRTQGSVMNSGGNKTLLMRKKMIKIYQTFSGVFGASELEWADIEKTYYRGIWRAAVNACSRDESIVAWAWLKKNDPRFAGKFLNIAWTYLTNTPRVLGAILKLRYIIGEAIILFRSQKIERTA